MQARPVRSLVYLEAEKKLIVSYAMPPAKQLPNVIAADEMTGT